MAAREFVQTEVDGGIATLTIDHPPANAFNHQTMSELGDAFADVSQQSDVRAIIITGAGSRFFVAGADIKELGQAGAQGKARDLIELGQLTFSTIEASRKPVIAAVNGICLGGGMELFLACHMRFASNTARFGQPEINLGIIPGWGGTQRLPRQIGVARAMALIVSGDIMTADDAWHLGLLNNVVAPDALMSEARGLAAKIASKGGLAVRAAVKSIVEGLLMAQTDGLKLEVEEMLGLLTTNDAREGFSAFLEKRPPAFTNS